MKIQSTRLGEEKIPALLVRLSVPAMVGMFVMALYNVVDMIFIARWVGTYGVAGVAISFPVQMIVMAISAAVGIGAASMISRHLGSGSIQEADHVFGNVLFVILLLSGTGAITGLLFLEPILKLFGSTEEIMPYASDYLGIILIGTVFFSFAMAVNNIVRAEGNAKVAMMTMVVAAVLNIILDPIFIYFLQLGVKGAAVATVLSQAIAVAFLLVYFAGGNSSLTIKLKDLKPSLPILKEMSAIGSSAFVRQVSSSVMFVAVNHMLVRYGGTNAVAVFGMVHKVLQFSFMPMMGIVQGLQPIVGYNIGSGRKDRVNHSIKLAIKIVTALSVSVFLMMLLFPSFFIRIFTNEAEVVQMGETALRIIFAVAFTVGIQLVVAGVHQAAGLARDAFILSVSRQLVFLIPLVLILPRYFQLNGVWLAFPASDILALGLTFFYIRKNKFLFEREEDIGPEAASPSFNRHV